MSASANNMITKVEKVPVDWHSGLSIYASEAYLRTVSEEFGWIAGLDDSGKYRCILPYAVIHKAMFRMVRLIVETIPIGDGIDAAAEKAFLNGVLDIFRLTKADMIIPSPANAIFSTYPDGAIAVPYGTYILELDQPEEIIWNNIADDFRKKIRRATKIGIGIKSGGNYLKPAYDLIVETLGRSNLSFRSFDEFKRIIFGLGDNVQVLVAEYGGIVNACMIVPFSKYSAYSLFSGRILEPAKGAMHLLQWEAIRQARENGVKRFNFMGVRINPEKGSRHEGIKNFKMRFGGILNQGYLWKYSFHPIKCFAYSIAVRVLRGGDVVDQERKNSKAIDQSGGQTEI